VKEELNSTLFVRLSDETHKELKLLAKERKKTISFITRKIIEKYFTERPIV